MSNNAKKKEKKSGSIIENDFYASFYLLMHSHLKSMRWLDFLNFCKSADDSIDFRK